MALTAFVTLAAVIAVAVWIWPAVADLGARIWSTLVGLIGTVGTHL